MLCVAIPVPDTSVRGRLGAARPVNSLDCNLDLHRGNPTERHCHKYWLEASSTASFPYPCFLFLVTHHGCCCLRRQRIPFRPRWCPQLRCHVRRPAHPHCDGQHVSGNAVAAHGAFRPVTSGRRYRRLPYHNRKSAGVALGYRTLTECILTSQPLRWQPRQPRPHPRDRRDQPARQRR